MGAERDDRATTPTGETTSGSGSAATPAGADFGERYVDQGLLGQGGMSIVHRVRDLRLLRAVALKRLREKYANRPNDVQRFVEEAQITGQLDHPNVISVHDLASDELGHPYFVMKLVEGQTLSDILAASALPRDGETLATLLGIVVKVCDAVAYAHSKGVIHRDIKPQNVMVGSFGEVYLNDWGLARILSTEDGMSMSPSGGQEVDDGSGTVWYMAPEQAVPGGSTVTLLTDVFGIGALLYEVLTGRPPYDGQTESEIRAKAFLGELRHPDEVLGQGAVPASLSRIAMKAMAREPEDRFPSVMVMRKELDRVLRGGEQLRIREFAPGDLVVTEGEPGDAAYVITEGRCRAFKMVGDRKVVLREMGPGDVFGETAIFTAKPRTASVEALEKLVVREVSRAALDDGLGMNRWMGTFVRALAERFREADAKLTELEEGARSGPKP
jgi:serine/threonine-protein kinase